METPLRSPPWPETDLHHQADNQEKAHGGDLQCRWWYQNDGCQCQEKVADQNKEAETITSARSHWRSANPQTQKETHEWNQNSCNAIRFFSQSTIKNYTSIMMWLIHRACNMTPHDFFRWQSPSPCTVSTKSKPCPRSILLEALEEEAIAVEQRQTVPSCSPDWVLIRGPSSPRDNAHWVQHNSHSPNCNQNPMICRLVTNRPRIVGHRTCAIWIGQTLERHQGSQRQTQWEGKPGAKLLLKNHLL